MQKYSPAISYLRKLRWRASELVLVPETEFGGSRAQSLMNLTAHLQGAVLQTGIASLRSRAFPWNLLGIYQPLGTSVLGRRSPL